METDTEDFRTSGKRMADGISVFFGDKKKLGILSALATFAAIAIFTGYTGALASVWTEFLSFMTGDLQAVVRDNATFLAMFPIILASVVIELPCTVMGAFIQRMILGKPTRHAISEELDRLSEGHLFMSFFLVTLAEELFARWLFLGLLTKIPALSGTGAFYVLFFLGNGLWALLHLSNYVRDKDRHPLRTLPQFIAGCFYGYLYVKFGFVAAVLAHFASNAIVFAAHKAQRLNATDALLIGYSVVGGGVSFALFEKPITDILPWFANNPSFVLQGWVFLDYLKASIFLGAVPTIIFGVLAYDRGGTDRQKSEVKVGFIGTLLVLAIALGMIYLLYWLLGFVITEVPFRVLALSILLSFSSKGKSGSAMARTFWVSLPSTYLTVCIMQALGFWYSLAWALIVLVLSVPKQWLLKREA